MKMAIWSLQKAIISKEATVVKIGVGTVPGSMDKIKLKKKSLSELIILICPFSSRY